MKRKTKNEVGWTIRREKKMEAENGKTEENGKGGREGEGGR